MKKLMMAFAAFALMAAYHAGYAQHTVTKQVPKTTVTTQPLIKNADPADPSMKGPKGETVYTGPKGGKYYLTPNNGKIYMDTKADQKLKGPNGETVYDGPQGGKYYLNEKGNKVYINMRKVDKVQSDKTGTVKKAEPVPKAK